MAGALIEGLSGDFDPTQYRDEYRDRVLALIERKAEGQPLTEAPGAAEATPTAAPDLMAALEASLQAVKSAGKPKPKAKRTRASDDTKAAATKVATGDEKPKRSRAASKSKAE
jgi:DNA end-binding protein Ku